MKDVRTARLPTLFISHGGGPCFSMDKAGDEVGRRNPFENLGTYLRGIDSSIGVRPKAVLVISGHWEAERPTVNTGKNPPLYFDYYGFPEHTYHLEYAASGAPELAKQVQDLLGQAGIETGTDGARGYDHGVFVPFMLIYPDADIPIVQLSLQENLDPAEHIAIGKALAPLRDQGVLIVGSGMSYHNLREFFKGNEEASKNFDVWLNEAVTDTNTSMRDEKLIAWTDAPSARACHPREDHLIPLMVAVGAAGGDVGRNVYSDIIFGKTVSCFQFG